MAMADEDMLLAHKDIELQVTPTGRRMAPWAKVSLLGLLVAAILGACLYHRGSMSPSEPNDFTKLSMVVQVADAATEKYVALKNHDAFSYVIFAIKDTAVVPVSVGDKATDFKSRVDAFKDFVIALPLNEPRFAVVQVPLADEKTIKTTFIRWIPDTARNKQRMMYTAAAGGVEGKFSGLDSSYFATNKCDLTLRYVRP